MPIVGLTDEVLPNFPRIGKLRKGGEKVKKTSNKGKAYYTYGPDLDHFRFTSPRPDVVQAWTLAFPDHPKSLQVFILHDRTQDAFPTWCEIWDASGLVHRCDGKTMVLWREKDGYEAGEKPCAGGHTDGNPKKDAVGRLSFIVPQLLEAGFVGCVTLETHSQNDIKNIEASLREAERARGSLVGIPFRLYRSLENVGVPGWGEREGERSRSDKQLVQIEPAAEWVRRQLARQKAEALQLAPPQLGVILEDTTLDAPVDEAVVSGQEESEQSLPAEISDSPKVSPPAQVFHPEGELWVDGILTYMMEGGIKKVRYGRSWMVADKQIGPNTVMGIYKLFDTKVACDMHVGSHFPDNISPATLSSEQSVALITWVKEQKPDPRWYKDEVGYQKVSTVKANPVDDSATDLLGRVEKAGLGTLWAEISEGYQLTGLEYNTPLGDIWLSFIGSVEKGIVDPANFRADDVDLLRQEFARRWKA